VLIVPPVADHVTGRPALSVEVNCCVAPACKVAEDGVTVTLPDVEATVTLAEAEYFNPVDGSKARIRTV
jgi:hypothetical protein